MPRERTDHDVAIAVEERAQASTTDCAKLPSAVIVACAVGVSSAFSWLPFASLFAQSYLSDSIKQGSFMLYAIVFTLGVILGSAAFSRLLEPTAEGIALASTLSLAVVGLALTGASVLYDGPHRILSAGGVFLLGADAALLWLYWDQVLVSIPKGSRTLIAVCSATVSSLAFYGTFLVSRMVVIAISATGIGISIVLLLVCCGQLTRNAPPASSPHTDTGLYKSTLRILLHRFLTASFCISAAFGVMGYQFGLASHSKVDVPVWASGVIGSLVLIVFFCAAHFINKEPASTFAFKLAGFTVIPAFFPLEPGTPFSLVFAISATLASATIIFGILPLVRQEVSQTVRDGFRHTGSAGLACQWLGMLLGSLLGLGFNVVFKAMVPASSGTLRISLLGLMCIVLVLVSTNVLISSESIRNVRLAFAGKVPITLDLNNYRYHEDESRGLLDLCKDIALSKGLTQRETEVLLILAKGNSLQRVQDELFISQGTATSHRNNIYRKLDIHRRQELMDYLDGFRRESRSSE